MELHLRLALPTNPAKAFDLNSHVYDHNDAVACLDPSSDTNCEKPALPQSSVLRSAFRRTLPLLLWNNQPNDDDDPKDLRRTACAFFPINKNNGEENGLVGWPPLKTRRKRLYVQKHGGRVAENRRTVENGGGLSNRGWRSNSRYVKVKMEGVGIARKVDLNLHNSFAALRATLMNMFDEKDLNGYRLAYLDMDGDWLHAEDVAWRNFIRIAQRIKLEKKNG